MFGFGELVHGLEYVMGSMEKVVEKMGASVACVVMRMRQNWSSEENPLGLTVSIPPGFEIFYFLEMGVV